MLSSGLDEVIVVGGIDFLWVEVADIVYCFRMRYLHGLGSLRLEMDKIQSQALIVNFYKTSINQLHRSELMIEYIKFDRTRQGRREEDIKVDTLTHVNYQSRLMRIHHVL